MFSTNFIATMPAHPDLGEAMNFLVTGFGVVMLALALLWFCTALMGKAFSAAKSKPAVAPAPAAPAAAPAPVAEDDGRLIAAISAAVHYTVGSGFRVTKVVRTGAGSPNWSAEGRRQHHGSHRIR